MARYPLMYTSSRLSNPMISDYLKQHKMKGGTIFGKSTRRHMNPLGFPSAHPEKEAFDYMMKGGTIFGKGDLRQVL